MPVSSSLIISDFAVNTFVDSIFALNTFASQYKRWVQVLFIIRDTQKRSSISISMASRELNDHVCI